MTELLTALQDGLDALSRRFFEAVGVLQRDAPPVAVSGEAQVLCAFRGEPAVVKTADPDHS